MDGVNAFLTACRDGHTGEVAWFLALEGDAAADIHRVRAIGLELASEEGRLGTVRKLLALKDARAIGPHACESAFWQACRHGHVAVVRTLLALEGGRVPGPAAIKRMDLEARYHAVRWDRRRAMLARRTAAQRAARAARATKRARRE